MKILIVDDEYYIQMIIQKILSRKGINSISCNNGKEALKILSEDNSIDMIFLDISLPDFNGLDLIEKFKNINKNIKIILMSGYQKENIDGIEKYNFDYFIFKPDLTNEINNIIK